MRYQWTKKTIQFDGGIRKEVIYRLPNNPANHHKRDKNNSATDRSLARSKNECLEYALGNKWDIFVTLTYSPEKVDRFNWDDVAQLMSRFTAILRKQNITYLLVPEYHANGAIHWHGFMAGKALQLVPTSHVNKTGKKVYNLPLWGNGFSTAVVIGDTFDDRARCGFYITKYFTKAFKDKKELVARFNQKRYWASHGLNRGKVIQTITSWDINELTEDKPNEYGEVLGPFHFGNSPWCGGVRWDIGYQEPPSFLFDKN